MFQLYNYDVAEAIAHGAQVGGELLCGRLDPDVSVVGIYHVDIRPESFFRFAVEVNGDHERDSNA